jgi:ketose-bisphosphate aldolase
MLVNLKQILHDARKRGYAVPHFNFSDLEVAQGVMEAAAELKSPIIFGTSESAIEYAGMENLVDIVRNLAEKHIEIPVALHLDHGKTFEVCQQAIEAGYTGVMIDGSKLEFNKNIELTKRVVKAAEGKVGVEAELGAMGVDAQLPTGNQAKEFVQKTKVDALAIGLGTAHGLPVEEERIHFDVLKDVAEAVSLPLVLHGGSNLPIDQIKKAITMGISKVNVDTELRQAFTKEVRKNLRDKKMLDPREYLGDAREAVRKVAKKKIKELNSGGKL